MQTVVPSRGYGITRTPGAIIIKVAEQRGVWPAICGFAIVVGTLLAWLCAALTASHAIGIVVGLVFVGPPALWWPIVSMRRRQMVIVLTADSLIAGDRRYAKADIRGVGVRVPGSAAFVAFGPLGVVEANAQARVASIARSQRYGLSIQYGHGEIGLSTRLTQVVAQDIAREIAVWLAAPASDEPPLSAVEVASLTRTDNGGSVGLRLMAASGAGWVVCMLAYAPNAIGEGVLGLAIWPLLGPLMLMGAKRDTHGIAYPPDALYIIAGAVFWVGAALAIRGAWRARGRKNAVIA